MAVELGFADTVLYTDVCDAVDPSCRLPDKQPSAARAASSLGGCDLLGDGVHDQPRRSIP